MTERDLSLGWLRYEIGQAILASLVVGLFSALAVAAESDALAIVAVIAALWTFLSIGRIGWRLTFPPKLKSPSA